MHRWHVLSSWAGRVLCNVSVLFNVTVVGINLSREKLIEFSTKLSKEKKYAGEEMWC